MCRFVCAVGPRVSYRSSKSPSGAPPPKPPWRNCPPLGFRPSGRRCVGREYEVLVEGVSKRSREQLFGRTEQNKVVVFDRGGHRPGELVRVRVTGSSSATLLGEVVRPEA